MSTILITGAQGQVGRELVARAAGRRVVGLGREALDITDPASVRQALADFRPALVVNAAAYTAVDRAESEPAMAFAVNADGPENLAAGCARAGIPLLHLSTDYVFDGTKPGPYVEDDPAAPLGVYGESKWQGECAIRERLEAHLILRVAWVFGAHGGNFVKTMLRLGRERPELRVVADQQGGPTPAAAIAETLLALADRALARERFPWGTYHYCGAPATTWHGFATAIFDDASARGLLPRRPAVEPIATADYPTLARRPANSVLDCSRLAHELGIGQPKWRTGLSDMLDDWPHAGTAAAA